MTHKFKKLTLSVATSALLANSAFALDPAITNFGYVAGDGTSLIFNISNPSNIKEYYPGSYPMTVAFDPRGHVFYESEANNEKIDKYNVYTGQLVNMLLVGYATGLAISADGSTIYAALSSWQPYTVPKLLTIDTITYTITNNTISFDGAEYLRGVVISPDSTKVFVVNASNNNVSVVNVANNTIDTTIAVGSNPSSIIRSADGTKVFVTNMGSDSVSVIDTMTNSVLTTITVGTRPRGIAFKLWWLESLCYKSG